MPNLYLPSRRVEVNARLGPLGAAFDVAPAEIAVDTLDFVLVNADFVQGAGAGTSYLEIEAQGQSTSGGTWRPLTITDLAITYLADGIRTTTDADIRAIVGPLGTERDFSLAFRVSVGGVRVLRLPARAVNGGVATTLSLNVAGNR